MATKNHNKPDITVKLAHAIEETRIILPGTQTLLGFQFTAFFAPGFKELAPELARVHLGSLGFVALSTMLLMSVVSYHRISERGEPSHSLHVYITQMVLLAMAALAVGLSMEIALAVEIVLQNRELSITVGSVALLLFVLLWFVFPYWRRARR